MRKIVRYSFILLIFIVLISGSASAGFDEGLAAYKQKDFDTALGEFVPLAEKGHGLSQFYLGLLYGFGDGVKKDLAEAVRWWRLASVQGNIAAQSNLGFMYKYGNGVTKDPVAAYMWSKIAAEGGATYARENLGVFAEGLTKADIAKAERLAKAWRDMHPPAHPAAEGKKTP